MKKLARILSLVLAVMMLCGMVSTVAFADEVIDITIPHYKTGENVGAKFFLPQVERFNELYSGKYHITVEELTQDMYLCDSFMKRSSESYLPVP